ncbi:cysteine proteinase inhibitor 1-like [Zingiber officinale]|uniref:Cystatin domain-containing protein n=1 Tax=Zingiber officinale TaxID=94328 RepID=A0A8J5LW41_ZINOF|nr:cysteine proteinase inhibitor 1-like [Zingiber officinale]KAG6525226.1 hypothetical protein ZIOFF_015180 [Zingiber officinale]
MMKSFSLILLLPLLLLLICNVDATSGGWKPIGDLQDPHVIDIAKFAVDEHNKEATSQLRLVSVVKGETQVVAGMNYRIILKAGVVGAKVNVYEAVVWEKEWEKFRKLISFDLRWTQN